MKQYLRFYCISAIVLFIIGLIVTWGDIVISLIFVAITLFCIWLENKYDQRKMPK